MNAEQHATAAPTNPAEAFALFGERLNDGDVDGLMELYDEEASFSPQEGVVVTGPEKIREALREFTSMQPIVTSNVKWVQRVGRYALVLHDWSLEGRQPDGQIVRTQGRSTDVLRCGEDGGWRFYIDCVWGGNG